MGISRLSSNLFRSSKPVARILNLENVRIAAPCAASWEEMTGDDRVRFCAGCKLNVYNLSEMTRIEGERLIASQEGRLCVRFFQRRDGTILTRNCPRGIQALSRRISRVAGAALSAVMSFSFSLSHAQTLATTPPAQTAKPDQKHGSVSIMVADPNGAGISGSEVNLIDKNGEKILTATADAEGHATITSLALGTYELQISARGFQMKRQTLQVAGKAIQIEVSLNVAAVLMGAVVVETVAEIPTDTSLVTPELTPYPIQALPGKKRD